MMQVLEHDELRLLKRYQMLVIVDTALIDLPENRPRHIGKHDSMISLYDVRKVR